jgi:hypothetical protein
MRLKGVIKSMNIATEVKQAKSASLVVTKHSTELVEDLGITILKSVICQDQLLKDVIHVKSGEKNLDENRIQRQVSEFKATQRRES